jgi:hypothetical protein
MQPVLRVHGQTAPDGRFQVVVTNTLTGQEQVPEVSDGETYARSLM